MPSKTKAGDPLTPREVEVAALIAEGLSNKLIGVRLNIAEHTAKFHVANVCVKYGTTSRTVVGVKHAVAQVLAKPCTRCTRSTDSRVEEVTKMVLVTT
jgi:DNA-binding CsgD family transcriptional regulator